MSVNLIDGKYLQSLEQFRLKYESPPSATREIRAAISRTWARLRAKQDAVQAEISQRLAVVFTQLKIRK